MSYSPNPQRAQGTPQCRAVMITRNRDSVSGVQPGQQCERRSVHTDPDGVALCWTHLHARYNENRLIKLEIVP